MIKYQSLVDGVCARAGPDASRARAAVEAVANVLAHTLPGDERQRLADALPGIVQPAARVTGSSDPRTGSAFVVEVARLLDASAERARYLTQAVLAELREGDPELGETLRTHLPSDTVTVLDTAGESPAVSSTVNAEQPTRLSDAEVDDALRALPGWAGDGSGISRTVSLPDDRVTPLVNRVQREARQMNDHAHVDRSPGTVTFTLRTGSASVTEPDLVLARRIDAAITGSGSGG